MQFCKNVTQFMQWNYVVRIKVSWCIVAGRHLECFFKAIIRQKIMNEHSMKVQGNPSSKMKVFFEIFILDDPKEIRVWKWDFVSSKFFKFFSRWPQGDPSAKMRFLTLRFLTKFYSRWHQGDPSSKMRFRTLRILSNFYCGRPQGDPSSKMTFCQLIILSNFYSRWPQGDPSSKMRCFQFRILSIFPRYFHTFLHFFHVV